MQRKDKKIRSAYASLTGFKRAVPIILFALALFTGLCFITPGSVGLGRYVGDFFKGLFSVGGYFIPFLLAIHAIFYPSDVLKKRTVSRLIFSIIMLLFFSAFLHAIKSLNTNMPFNAADFYRMGKELSGGGFFGGILGFILMKVFGPVGLIIIAALVFALYVTYFFANGKSTLAKILLVILDKISSIASRFSKKHKAERQEKRERKEAKKADARAPRLSEKHSDLYEDEFFSVNNGLSELKVEELGINEKRNPKDMELFPKLQDKVVHEDDYEEKENIKEILDILSACESNCTEEACEDIEIEPSEAIPTEASDKESADGIFTKEFDPFDFANNAELERRQANAAKESHEAINEYAEPVRVFSEKEINAARMADFEARKKALQEAEQRRKALEEEAEKQRKIQELLRDEPKPEKATYTSYSAAAEAEEQPSSENTEKAPAEQTQEIPDDVYESRREAEMRYERAADFISAINGYNEEKASNSRESAAAAVPPSPTYTITENQPEETDNDSDFTPYSAPSLDSLPIAEKEEDEALKIGREYISPTPSFDISEPEEDEEDDEDGFEIGFGDEGKEEDFGFGDIIPEEERNPDILSYRERFSVFKKETEEKPEAIIVTDTAPLAEECGTFEESEGDDELYSSNDISEPEKTPAPKAEKPKAADYSSYKNPPIDLLKKGAQDLDDSINDEITRNGEKLIDTLAEFNVKASIRSVDVGPRITRYEVVPAKGVRVNAVMNLYDDIKLGLAADGLRMEAPIPGKSAIGIEVPNKKPQLVYLRDLLETDEFKSAESTTMACFGKDVAGNPVFGDIAKMPHMLIAGATGMGKSVCINSIMISMLYKARPDELKFIMIDPKMVEFNGYNGIPHLLIPVIIDVRQAAGALMWAVEQMEKRYEMFLKYSVRNLDGYNQKMRENPTLGEPLPKIVIVIDELNDLMLQARKPVEDLIMRIAQKARAAGIHLIIGTQRPSVDVITGVIKANIPSRIACKVASFTDSKTILEQAGAERLLDKGDMLFWPVGKPSPTRVQGAFVSDGEVEKIMDYLKSQRKGAAYDEEALDEINRAAQKCTKNGKGDDYDDDDDEESGVGIFNDPQFLEAVSLAVKQRKIATSLIQRKIGVGYGKAAKFIDQMESQGFVSKPNGQKPRDVLISEDEWHEILARRSIDND